MFSQLASASHRGGREKRRLLRVVYSGSAGLPWKVLEPLSLTG